MPSILNGYFKLIRSRLMSTSSSFNVTLSSDTHKLNLSILILNFQCLGVAKEGNIKRVLGLTL